MRSTHFICVALAAFVLWTYPFQLAGEVNTAVTGIVKHPSVQSYSTIVYIDGVPDQQQAAPSANSIVELKQKGFSPVVLPIVVGTTVKFANNDSRKHSVFSLDGEKYDLGELNEGQSKEHQFTEPGVYMQLCAKHPRHVAYIVVLKSPYFALTNSNGSFRIVDVPAGAWDLKVWNEALALSQTRQSYPVRVAAGLETKVEIEAPQLPDVGKFWLEPPPPGKADLVERGAWLFRQRGCFLCHGERGIGGVRNRNYVKGTIPALDTIAERLMLFDSEDVRLILDQMKRGRKLEALRDDPPVPRFDAFLAQYTSVQDVIRKGSPAGKAHPKGPKPPLDMPRNKDVSQEDINALVAYLLTLQSWQEKER